MTTDKHKRGLGRGLDALFADAEARVTNTADNNARTADSNNAVASINTNHPNNVVQLPETVQSPSAAHAPQSNLMKLPLGKLQASAFQPRRHFDDKEIASLAESIKAHGILQPLLVRAAADGMYDIIGGERRWRAAQLAQLHDVPVIVQALDDRAALEIAIIENIQRQDLTPLEEARAFQRLIDEFQQTHDELAHILGKSRSYVSNTLRLLSLPQGVTIMLENGLLSSGHARALLGAKDPGKLAIDILKRNLTVREAERQAQWSRGADVKPVHKSKKVTLTPPAAAKDANTMALEKEISELLGFRTTISATDKHGQGSLSIAFRNLDQLDDILKLLTKAARV